VIHPENVDFLTMLKENSVGNPTVMWRRSANLKFDEAFSNFSEDYELWGRAVRTCKIANVPKALVRYRWHPDGISKIYNKELIEKDLVIKQRMLDFLTTDKNLQKKIAKLIAGPQRVKLFGFIPLWRIK
jgi:hypothetical protein